jgi:MoaA/NifB/PqqE/SkfB family radical SAM enzyme
MFQQVLHALTRAMAGHRQPLPATDVQAALVPPAARSLDEAIASARPSFPSGFQGAVPDRWYNESHNVLAIQAWIRDRKLVDSSFDAVQALHAFAAKAWFRASPQIALALEYRTLGDKSAAMAAMTAALSRNHWDLYTQDIASDIMAWAEGQDNPAEAADAYLQGCFCPVPFEMLETTPNGDAYVCCPSWLPIPIGNIERQTADQIWNSPIAQELRRSILDRSFRYCSKMHCSKIGNKWLPAAHSAVAIKWREIPVGAALPGPKHVILSHDQSCNLACPSCRNDFILANKQQQASLDKLMDDFVLPILRQAEIVKVTGSGDPFGSNHFRRVLKSISREEFPGLAVDLHTNAQLWNERAWSELGLAAVVRNAEISIDAAQPATYAVIRRGGDFDRLLENLAFIKTLRETGQLAELCLSFVVQAGNFREMPDFVLLGERFGADLIQFNMIRNWGTYSQEEFQTHFIGSKTHPDYAAFLEVLGSPALRSPRVAMGNVLRYAT